MESRITPSVLALYFFPFLLWYCFLPHSSQEGTLFAVGVVAIGLCAIILFLVLKKYEAQMQERCAEVAPLPAISSSASLVRIAELEEQLKREREAVVSLQAEKEAAHKMKGEIDRQESAYKEKIESKEQQIEELKQAIKKSCDFAAAKEEQIAALRSEISNLQFELKTLSKVDRGTAASLRSSLQSTPLHATPQEMLDRALHTVLALAESGQLKGTTTRLLDISNMALENRRLFNALSQHAPFPLFVFCKREEKLLFTCRSHELFGMPAEELQHQFFSSLIDGEQELRKTFRQICPFEIKKVALRIGSLGKEKFITLFLGICPLPPFSHTIVAVADQGRYTQ